MSASEIERKTRGGKKSSGGDDVKRRVSVEPSLAGGGRGNSQRDPELVLKTRQLIILGEKKKASKLKFGMIYIL